MDKKTAKFPFFNRFSLQWNYQETGNQERVDLDPQNNRSLNIQFSAYFTGNFKGRFTFPIKIFADSGTTYAQRLRKRFLI